MTLKLIVLLALSFVSTQIFAGEICERENIFLENIRITRGTFPTTQRCFVGIAERNPKNLVYRDFMFASDGLIMVFSSYGDGPSSTTTGAQEYHVFPRVQNPTYEILEDTVVITMSNGDKMTFDKNSAKPLYLEGGDMKFNSAIKLGDKGGFKIENYKYLLMDSGFSMGMNPTWTLSKSSDFIFENGEICKVQNKELFVRTDDENWWKYKNDRDLLDFLAKRCK